MTQSNFEILRSQFNEVLVLKNYNKGDGVLTEKRKVVSMMIVLLKKLSRNDKSYVKTGRDELLKKKNQVDSYRLHLQNLLYEINHLKREIRNCYHFKSLDEDINLLSEDDYAITNGSSEPSHSLRVKCLESELNLRKQLYIDYNDLLNTKKTLYRDILLKIERHSLFIPALKVLVKATHPLTEALQISLTEEWKLNELVNLLPRPLYLTFINLHALQQTLESFQVEVLESEILQGSTENRPNSKDLGHIHHLLKPSKYMIRITIWRNTESDDYLLLDIRYFNEIGFSTISSSILSKKTETNISKEASQNDILRYIIEKDFGDDAPTPTCETKLKKFDLTVADAIIYLDNSCYGKPYIWLQKFCSIPVYSCLKWNEKKLQKFMFDIVGKIKQIWNYQMSLLKQIHTLTNKCYENFLQNNSYGYKPISGLAQWTSIKWQDYKTQKSTDCLIKFMIIDKYCNFYRAVIVRGSAKLECLVAILGKLSSNNPVWALCLHWNGERTAKNDASIKEMEFCVNSVDLTSHDAENKLFSQLLITMMNLDLYLESKCRIHSSTEFISDNIIGNPLKNKPKGSNFFPRKLKL